MKIRPLGAEGRTVGQRDMHDEASFSQL